MHRRLWSGLGICNFRIQSGTKQPSGRIDPNSAQYRIPQGSRLDKLHRTAAVPGALSSAKLLLLPLFHTELFFRLEAHLLLMVFVLNCRSTVVYDQVLFLSGDSKQSGNQSLFVCGPTRGEFHALGANNQLCGSLAAASCY